MRKFFVYYRVYLGCGEYEYYTFNLTINANEKANVETFENKLNDLGGCKKEIISWSFVEE